MHTEKIYSINLDRTLIGPDKQCYIIAEIGQNHNGNMDLAKQLISIAAESGVNAVKFQKRYLQPI